MQNIVVPELGESLRNLVEYVHRCRLPVSEEIALDSAESLTAVLEQLVASGLLHRYAEGPEVVYGIAPEQHLAAAYYRNTVIHFFVTGAIAELALLRAAESGVTDRRAEFWNAALALRDLLKFEFFFPDRERFVSELKEEARRRPFAAPAAPDPEPGRRRHGRHVATFKIRPRSLARLHEMYTRDISRGGMFIVTDQLIPVGESIKVDVVHPDTHERFILVCVVRRAMRDPGRTGLGVEFVDMDEDRRVLFQQFIESGAAGA